MAIDRLTRASALTDAALLSRLARLAESEHEAIADLVAHLAILDVRRLHLGEGYGSLFAYCTGVLRLSEYDAYNRIEAARTSRRFPHVLELLAAGSLNAANLRLLAPHLTLENHRDVLAAASGRSKREVERLVARLAPWPEPAPTVRKLPSPATTAARSGVTAPVDSGTAPPRFIRVAAPVARPVVAPVAPERYRLQFTVGRETHERLRRVQDLLRREIPNGDPGAIFDRGLALLLDEVERKKLAATSRPRPGRPTGPDSRHIPAEVRRTVWRRDGGQCAFVAPNGRRCAERAFLEFHHVRPWSVGGPATVANISLRCRAHNAHEAERFFGRG